MRLTRCSPVAVIAMLFVCGVVPVAHAQSVDELKQRIEELERSTREQVDALKRMLQQQEAERAKERRAQEERERTLRSLQDQVEQQQFSLQKQKEDVSQALAGLSSFFDLEAGAEQTNNGPPRFLGEDIPGNVYSGKDFKSRLGGSLRLHVQHNDTPVGESVSRALVPNTSAPGGGNNASREVFRAFVSRTRLNLAMQGPETVGAKTSAYFEMDFNQQANGNGEVNAVNNNPRLRWAIGRWAFPNFLVNGNELIWTFGQGDAFDQITPDTIDYNTLLAGLGDAERRNPRVELVDQFPLTSNLTFLTSLGFDRPLFDAGFLGGTTDYQLGLRPARDPRRWGTPRAGAEPRGLYQPAVLPDGHAEPALGRRRTVGARKQQAGDHRDPARRPGARVNAELLPREQLPIGGQPLVDARPLFVRARLQLHEHQLQERQSQWRIGEPTQRQQKGRVHQMVELIAAT